MAPAPRPLQPVLGHQGTPGTPTPRTLGTSEAAASRGPPEHPCPEGDSDMRRTQRREGNGGKGWRGDVPCPLGSLGLLARGGTDRQTEPPACTIGDFLRKGSVSSGTKGSYAAAQQRRGAARAHKSRGSCWGPPATSPQLPFEDAKTVPAPSRPGGTSHWQELPRCLQAAARKKKKKQHHKKPGRQRGI